MLASAEREHANVREQMFKVALPLHKQWFPEHGAHSELTGDALQNTIISEVIGRINNDHAQPGQLLEQVRSQAETIRDFIAKKDLLTLSSRDNMKVGPRQLFCVAFTAWRGSIQRRLLIPRQTHSIG